MGRWRLLGVLAGVVGVVVFSVAGAEGANGHANARAVCPGPVAGHAHCHVLVVTDSHGNPAASSQPSGLSPATIQSVYDFPTAATAGSGQTIAIVDAYDDPTAESDLGVFSNQFGLPPCTTGNGCFTKVDQHGGTHYPRASSGWALEISLDVQWAHAIAPGAHILLVEARSNSFSNLLAAEDYASGHAGYVSNSWGGSESSGESAYDSYFERSGVSFFVSAGDAGLPAEYPSASPDVISVGGTTLHFSGGSFTGETGWSDGGGGCSAYESANPAQSGFSGYTQAGCGDSRATPDVALDADPSSGVAVYDSTRYSGQTGWFTVGGTSASSPMWAARAADAGVTVDASYVYGDSIGFRDITSGNNGAPCLPGFDLCTGRGSWTGGSSQPPAQESLAFSPGAQTLTAGERSTAMQVTVPAAAPAGGLTVSLTSSSASGRFETSTGEALASVTILGGSTSSGDFYYEDTKAGSPTLTASADGYTEASQTETVVAAVPATITVTPGSASVPTGGTQDFTASGDDAYGNAVDVGGAAWTSTIGAVAPPTGSSTTFTATSTGTGTVTATLSGVSGVATVTVTEVAPPTAPTDLTADARGKHVALSWQDTDSDVTYDLYRGTVSGEETLYQHDVASTSVNDMDVGSGTTYFYTVIAVGPGGQSDPSNEASVTTR